MHVILSAIHPYPEAVARMAALLAYHAKQDAALIRAGVIKEGR